jgi:hypothetical protein
MIKIRYENKYNLLRYKNILVVISLVYRPLSFSELAVLANLGPEPPKRIIEKYNLFLTTKKNTIYLIH